MSEMPPSPFAPPRTENLFPSASAGVEVPQGALDALRRTRPWTILLAITTFITAGLMIVSGLMSGIMAAFVPSTPEAPAAGGAIVAVGILYLALGALYVYPGIRLLQYGLAIGRLLQQGDSASLVRALDLQMRFWRFAGIATVAAIGLGIVFMVVLVVLAASGRLQP